MEVQGAGFGASGGNEYGYNIDEIEGYLEQIKSGALTDAIEALEDTSSIESAAEASWDGQARDNWITNLKSDQKFVADQLQTLYYILEKEVHDVGDAMKTKDHGMITVGK